MANGNGNLMDEFEEAFQHCLHVLTKQDPQRYDDDVIKLEVEQTTMNFLNLARQIDVFFLQKRFLLSALKPELLLTEENSDLKNELARKEELIKKHSDKIEQWKKLLSEQPKTMPTNVGPVPVGNPVGMPQQQMNPNMVGPGMQSPMHMQQMQQMQQQQQQQQVVNQHHMHQQHHVAAVVQQQQQQRMIMNQGMYMGPGSGPLSYLDKTSDMLPSGNDSRR